MPGATTRGDMQVGRDGPGGPMGVAGGRRRRAALAAWAAWMIFARYPPVVGQEAAAPRPEPARLYEVVETLASPEFAGRSGAGGEKAAAYLVDRFRRLELE